ncbi:hypothetical protein Pyn_08335 [Prunus yedoensis var. nudiflora]|uniref:Uncharacterized protein n=1 Tax=Prunus yedoensis var. nudiflora TaxID=2094558 RepID=A0A314Z0K7_PRUYE|nr:hypothetical protein Pyn_08335 [Prunus yedoensis var. nudiflora]
MSCFCATSHSIPNKPTRTLSAPSLTLLSACCLLTRQRQLQPPITVEKTPKRISGDGPCLLRMVNSHVTVVEKRRKNDKERKGFVFAPSLYGFSRKPRKRGMC